MNSAELNRTCARSRHSPVLTNSSASCSSQFSGGRAKAASYIFLTRRLGSLSSAVARLAHSRDSSSRNSSFMRINACDGTVETLPSQALILMNDEFLEIGRAHVCTPVTH